MSNKKREAEIQKHFYDEVETTFRGEPVVLRCNKKVVARTKKHNNTLRRERGIDRAINFDFRLHSRQEGISRLEAQEIVSLKYEEALQQMLVEVAMWAACADDLFTLTDAGLESKFDVQIEPSYWESRQDIETVGEDDFDKLAQGLTDAPVITVNPKNPFEIMIAIVLHMVEEDEGFREDLMKIASLVCTLANGYAEAVDIDEIGFLRERVDESLSTHVGRRNRLTKRQNTGERDTEIKVIVRKPENSAGQEISGGIDRGASDQGNAVSGSTGTDSDESKPVSEGMESS